MNYNIRKNYNLLIDYESYGIKPPQKFRPNLNTINENYDVRVNLNDYGLKPTDSILITDYIVGEGTSSCIYKGKYNELDVGIKTIKKEWMNDFDYESINREISIHSNLDHNNIIKFYKNYETNSEIKIVLEYADTDLKNIMKKERLTENKCKNITKNVINGLKYLHDKDIIHRDIKPSNILLKNNVPKICDFGLSKNEKIILNNGFVGTNGYIAPEIQNGFNYTSKVDMWALGIIIFQMIGGYHPYSSIPCKFSTANINYSNRYWENISNNCKDFINNLLICDPNDRISANEAFNHEWLLI